MFVCKPVNETILTCILSDVHSNFQYQLISFVCQINSFNLSWFEGECRHIDVCVFIYNCLDKAHRLSN